MSKLKNKIFQPEHIFNLHLKYQTRKICVFPDEKSFAEGSIEGKVAIKNFKDLYNLPPLNQETGTTLGTDSEGKDKFAFRFHRNKKVIHL